MNEKETLYEIKAMASFLKGFLDGASAGEDSHPNIGVAQKVCLSLYNNIHDLIKENEADS